MKKTIIFLFLLLLLSACGKTYPIGKDIRTMMGASLETTFDNAKEFIAYGKNDNINAINRMKDRGDLVRIIVPILVTIVSQKDGVVEVEIAEENMDGLKVGSRWFTPTGNFVGD